MSEPIKILLAAVVVVLAYMALRGKTIAGLTIGDVSSNISSTEVSPTNALVNVDVECLRRGGTQILQNRATGGFQVCQRSDPGGVFTNLFRWPFPHVSL